MIQQRRVVAGRYELRERIGSGSMGVVWRAHDQVLHRTVAIKQIVPPAGLDGPATEQAAARARREARTVARLRHRNAVTLFDVIEEDGLPWLVMEYLPARSLAQRLAAEGALPPEEVAGIGVQVASALLEAHRAGIVHRDVKPGNILLTEDGTAKLVDFGISRAVGDVTLTANGLVQGTPAYLAPEVANGARPSPASDVFSLGATLYRTVEGIPPFGSDPNPLALLRTIASGTIRPPQLAGPLTDVLLAMLRAKPADRIRLSEALPALSAAEAPTKPEPIVSPWSTSDPTNVVAPHPAEENEKQRPLIPTRTLVFGLVLLAVTVGALLAGTMMLPKNGGATPPAAAGTSTSRHAPPPPAPTTTTTMALPTTTTIPATNVDVRTFIINYYALLPTHLDQASRLLTPRYLASVGGFPAFQNFYNTISAVQVQQVTATGPRTATAVLVFTRNDGTQSVETYNFTLVLDDNNLQIDQAVHV
jgi:serine/threonine protein kinase